MGDYTKRLQEFLDKCVIPDMTPIIYKDRVIGHTMGENDCKKPIKALIYPFNTSVNFLAQDFADGKINVTSLSLNCDDESTVEIALEE